MPARVLLLDPPHRIFGALRMWTPSPGLMALAAYLEEKGIAVDILDSTTFDLPWTDLKVCLNKGQYDIVGVTCSAATFHFDALNAVRFVRKVLPRSIIVGGGGHFAINAEGILTDLPELDYLVIGEGEETFLELIQWLEKSWHSRSCPVPGLMYRKKGKIKVTPSRPLIEDLDMLPFPA